eukprot:SAG11_NODE_1444_length_4893_cov_7.649979_5_plen_59_part_00
MAGQWLQESDERLFVGTDNDLSRGSQLRTQLDHRRKQIRKAKLSQAIVTKELVREMLT